MKNICTATNRPKEKLSRIFAPYLVDLNMLTSADSTSLAYKDKEQQDLEQSRFVFQQILTTDTNAQQVYS